MTRAAIAVAALAVGAAALVAVATAPGVGLTPDSASYVGAARSLAAGDGLRDPVAGTAFTAWPPLYPALLAALSAAGPSVEGAARWANVAFVAATVVLAFVAARRAGAPTVAAVLAAGAVAAARATTTNAAVAQTETLFTLLVLAALAVAAEHLRRPQTAAPFVAAGLLLGAVGTRYLGLAAVGAVVLAFALRRRLADAGLVLLATLLPLAGWLAWTAANGPRGTPAGRTVVWHPPAAGELRGALGTVSQWWLPAGLAEPARLALTAVAIAGTAAWLVRRLLTADRRAGVDRRGGVDQRSGVDRRRAAAERGAVDPLVDLGAAFVGLYLAALLVSKALLDALTPLDERLLSPLLPVLAVTVAAAAPRAVPAVAVAVAVVVTGQAVRTVGWAADQRDEGIGYTSALWDVSPTLDVIRSLPRGVAVYTNDRAAVYLGTGRTVDAVPHEVNPFTRRPVGGVGAEVAEIGTEVRAGRAVVVWFHQDLPYVVPEAELVRRAGITESVEHFDSTIWGPAAPPAVLP